MHLYLVWYGTGSFVWLQKLHPCCALFLLQTQRYSLPRSDSELAFLNNDLVVERFKKQDKVMARPIHCEPQSFWFPLHTEMLSVCPTEDFWLTVCMHVHLHYLTLITPRIVIDIPYCPTT